MVRFCYHHAIFVASVALSPLAAQSQEAALQSTLAPSASANAASSNANSAAKFASGGGTLLYLGAGTLLPLLEDGPDGKEHALRTLDSLLVSTLITEGLKRAVREKRPGSATKLNSFPSGHATAAFAVATMQANYHPQQALFWYGGASLIAYSRVKLNRHYYHDVIAGAAVGYLTSRWELSRPDGLVLAPFIKSRRAGSNGLSLSMSF